MVLPEGVNWGAVWQSATDTWLPLFAALVLTVLILGVATYVQGRKR